MTLALWILGGAGVCWGLVWIVGRWRRTGDQDFGSVPLTEERRANFYETAGRQDTERRE